MPVVAEGVETERQHEILREENCTELQGYLFGVPQAIEKYALRREPGPKPSREGEALAALSAHSFRVGLTQDLFAAGADGAGIALALRWSLQAAALRDAREARIGSNAAARVLGTLRGGGLDGR